MCLKLIVVWVEGVGVCGVGVLWMVDWVCSSLSRCFVVLVVCNVLF